MRHAPCALMNDLFRITSVCVFAVACHAGRSAAPSAGVPIAAEPAGGVPGGDAPVREPPAESPPGGEAPADDAGIGGAPVEAARAGVEDDPGGAAVCIRIGETAHAGDDLSLALTSFSHKRPARGGPTQATAYLRITRGGRSGELELSEHGVEGLSEAEDGLTPEERYDRTEWGGYEIRLTGLDYDESVELRLQKKK